jgi:hypothetical protein
MDAYLHKFGLPGWMPSGAAPDIFNDRLPGVKLAEKRVMAD